MSLAATQVATSHLPNMPDRPYPSAAWHVLQHQLSAKRRAKMLAVAAQRTKHVRLILQDIHDPHNISACLRSAEAFGLMFADVVTLRDRYKPGKVARGVHRWLDISTHPSIESAIKKMKDAGYLLAAGYPDQAARPLRDVAIDQPLAVVFGNEHEGVHADWRPHIDIPFTIPMVGQVESLNISVSCAISLYDITSRCQRQLEPSVYLLDERQRLRLLSQWVCEQYPNTWRALLERGQ